MIIYYLCTRDSALLPSFLLTWHPYFPIHTRATPYSIFARNSASATRHIACFRSLAADDVESLVLVKQCRFLEVEYGSSFTSDIISNVNNISYTRIKKVILEKDISLLFNDSESHPSQHLIHCIATSPNCSWPKIWDHALDKGAFGTSCTLAYCCPLFTDHTSANFTVEQCVESLKSCSDTVYEYGKLINDVFRSIIL